MTEEQYVRGLDLQALIYFFHVLHSIAQLAFDELTRSHQVLQKRHAPAEHHVFGGGGWGLGWGGVGWGRVGWGGVG